MTARKILRMGNPFLHRIAEPVREFDTPELRAIVADLFETMKVANGAGLAAPQVGIGLRIVIFGFDANPRYPGRASIPVTVLVNPVIEPIGTDMSEDWEGCLSVPGLRGQVERYERIRYRGFDPAGAPIDRTVDGFHARVVQHECDHLDGILYPMRMRDLGKLGYIDELAAAGRITVPIVAE
jgi:peptide deformylase